MADGFLFENIEDFTEKNNTEEKIKINRKKRMKKYNPDEYTLFYLEPDKMFPEGTYERFIVDIIKRLDLTKFEYTDKDDQGGNEEYNPKSMLGILFYGFTNGIFHGRKLENLCKYDARYIYISGSNTPEHSTISRFIADYTKQIIELFTQVLYIAIEFGYVNYKMTITDGTRIKANAGKKYSGTIEDFKKRKSRLEKKIKLAIMKQKIADRDDIAEYWGKKEERYKKAQDKICNFLEDAKEIYTKRKKEVEQNITDNDSRIMKAKDGGFIQGYNAQVSACEENGIVLACDVTNNSSDMNSFQTMVEKTIEGAPEEKKKDVKEGKWINDNGYYSIDNIKYCDENKLDAYISDNRDKEIYKEGNEEEEIVFKNGCKKKGEDLYCKKSVKLKLKKVKVQRNERFCVFMTENKERCKGCEYYKDCAGKKKGKEFWIKESIFKNIDKIIAMKKKLRTEEGRMIYSRRMPTVEKIFGYIKDVINYKRFTLKGKEKVDALWHLLCMAYNLRRIYTLKYVE